MENKQSLGRYIFVLKKLQKHQFVLSYLIFGSFAKGMNKSTSDIDILIVTMPMLESEQEALSETILQIQQKTSKLHIQPPRILQEVMTEVMEHQPWLTTALHDCIVIYDPLCIMKRLTAFLKKHPILRNTQVSDSLNKLAEDQYSRLYDHKENLDNRTHQILTLKMKICLSLIGEYPQTHSDTYDEFMGHSDVFSLRKKDMDFITTLYTESRRYICRNLTYSEFEKRLARVRHITTNLDRAEQKIFAKQYQMKQRIIYSECHKQVKKPNNKQKMVLDYLKNAKPSPEGLRYLDSKIYSDIFKDIGYGRELHDEILKVKQDRDVLGCLLVSPSLYAAFGAVKVLVIADTGSYRHPFLRMSFDEFMKNVFARNKPLLSICSLGEIIIDVTGMLAMIKARIREGRLLNMEEYKDKLRSDLSCLMDDEPLKITIISDALSFAVTCMQSVIVLDTGLTPSPKGIPMHLKRISTMHRTARSACNDFLEIYTTYKDYEHYGTLPGTKKIDRLFRCAEELLDNAMHLRKKIEKTRRL